MKIIRLKTQSHDLVGFQRMFDKMQTFRNRLCPSVDIPSDIIRHVNVYFLQSGLSLNKQIWIWIGNFSTLETANSSQRFNFSKMPSQTGSGPISRFIFHYIFSQSKTTNETHDRSFDIFYHQKQSKVSRKNPHRLLEFSRLLVYI